MASASLSSLHRQIKNVRRRLFLQSLVNHLLFSVAGVLLVAALWFLVQPFLIPSLTLPVRWAILGGAVGAGVILAVVLTFLRAPSRLEAALALDERFGLKERVTTMLTLSEEQVQSPAGMALLQDVEGRLRSLAVTSKFPLRLSGRRVLLPFGAAALALLTVFFEPDLSWLNQSSNPSNTLTAAEVQEAQKHLDQLKKLKKKDEKEQTAKSEELKELEAEWKKLIEQQIDPKDKDQLREHTQKIRNLEEKMKNRLDDLKALKQKKNRLEDQLEQLRAALTPKQNKDGPAQELLEALKKGDSKKIEDALEKLQKKLAEEKLDKNELKKLEDQIRELQDQLQRLTDELNRKKEQLERAREDGNLGEEEMAELEREMEALQELQDLLDQLGECQNCLQGGNGKQVAGSLRDLVDRLKKMNGKLVRLEGELKELKLSDEEMKELEEGICLLGQCAGGLCRALGQGDGGPPGGQRPKGKEEAYTAKETRQDVDVDDKGEFKVTGFSRGGSFKKIPQEDVPGTFRRTAQEAQRAIETQRVTPEEAEILKGYYENLGGRQR